MKVSGGCHCGAVRFSFEVQEQPIILDCNCSICSATGFLHLIVPHDRFELEADTETLQSYRFGTGAANHLFCKNCGIKSVYQPRSHPEAWSVNLRCLDPGHGLEARIETFDGRNWEAAKAGLSE